MLIYLCLSDLINFADKLEEASLKTINEGTMTKDLALMSDLENIKAVNSENFIKAIRANLEKALV